MSNGEKLTLSTEPKPTLGETGNHSQPPPYQRVEQIQPTTNPTEDIIEPIVIPQPAHTVGQNSKPLDADKSNTRDGVTNYVVPLERLAGTPEWIDCPFCQSRAQTKVSENESSATGFAALGCCLFCGVITVCLPYLMHCFYDTDHHCTNCGKQVMHMPHDGIAQPIYPAPVAVQRSKYAMMSEEEKMRLQPGITQPTSPLPASVRQSQYATVNEGEKIQLPQGVVQPSNNQNMPR